MNMTLNKDRCFFDVDKINKQALVASEFILNEDKLLLDTISFIAKDIISQNKKIILLSGPSSSGKTTTSYKFIDEFHSLGVSCIVISLDNFFKNRNNIPFKEDNTRDFESIDVINIELVQAKFNELINNKFCMMPLFDFEKGIRIDDYKPITIDKNTIVIVEGIHALNDLISSGLSETNISKIYISAHSSFIKNNDIILTKRDVRLIRRIVRDYNFRNTLTTNTMSMWENVCSGEDMYISPFRKHANYLINTTFSFDISILKPYITPLLEQVSTNDANFQKAQSLLTAIECFDEINSSHLLENSLLREFIGGGKYNYA